MQLPSVVLAGLDDVPGRSRSAKVEAIPQDVLAGRWPDYVCKLIEGAGRLGDDAGKAGQQHSGQKGDTFRGLQAGSEKL